MKSSFILSTALHNYDNNNGLPVSSMHAGSIITHRFLLSLDKFVPKYIKRFRYFDKSIKQKTSNSFNPVIM